MSSETIEGEPSYLEAIPILSPSMPILDVSSEHISKPILDPNDPSYTLSSKTHDDPRNTLRYLKHRSHDDYKDDLEEPRQWLEDVKNSYAIEWMDEALDKINLRVTNPREILDNKMTNECHRHGMMETMFPPIDIHEETPLELEKEDDINKHGSYFLNTSSNPCSHEKSPKSIGLSNIATHEIFNPSYFLFIKALKGWL